MSETNDNPTVKAVQQIEEWFNGKIEELNNIQDGELKKIELGDEIITDKKVIAGFKLGIYSAKELIGEWPFELTQREDEEETG